MKLLLMFLLLLFTHVVLAHETTVVNGAVTVAGDDSGGKITISGEAAKKIFEVLPKGCQKAHFSIRFGTGISCLKNSQQNDYQCMIGYNQEGLFALFGKPADCSGEATP